MLVLLGAGASFGSEPGRWETPPLGKNLFAKLVERGGIASSLSVNLKEMFENDFELGMAEFYEKHSDLLQPFHRELARYLVEFSPSNESYYHKLVKLLKDDDDVFFASLNYDLMLELSVWSSQRNVNYGKDLYELDVRIIKPHGSVNFWSSTSPGMFQNAIFGGHGKMILPIKPLNQADTIRRCNIDTSLSPAISLYAKGKEVVVAPSFVAEQQRVFSDVCKSVKNILILGARVIKEDTHIWGGISSSSARVTYFGGEQDKIEVSEWVAETGKKVEFVEGFFPSLLEWIEEGRNGQGYFKKSKLNNLAE